MLTIFKGLFNTSDEEIIESVLHQLNSQSQAIVFNNEVPALKYLTECFENSHLLPTETEFIRKFPEFTVGLKEAPVVSEQDLRVHLGNFIVQRTNQNTSRLLLEISKDVVTHGLTSEHLDRLSQYVKSDTDLDQEDVTESPDAYKEFLERKKRQPVGLQTNIKAIDSRIGGVPKGKVMGIGGFTSHGKSLLANNIGYFNAKVLKYNICIVGLEIPKEDTLGELLARHSMDTKFSNPIPAEKFRDAMFTPDEEKFIYETLAPDFYNTGGCIKLLDETDFETKSLYELRKKLKEVDDEMRAKTGYPLDGVIWDHAQLFKFDSKERDDKEAGNKAVNNIRRLALNFRKDPVTKEVMKLSMIVCSQISRTKFLKAAKNNGRYDNTCWAEINELERAMTIGITIFMDDYMKAGKEAAVCLLKNRQGATMSDPVQIYCDPAYYIAGDEMSGFNDSVSISELDSIFDTGDIADMF